MKAREPSGWSQSRRLSVWGALACSVVTVVAVIVGTAVPAFAAPPDAPDAPIVTPQSGALQLDFTPPANDGGSPITGYTAACTPVGGGGPISATGASSPITVSGLTNGTSYTCTVFATNADGDGVASAPSNPATPSTVPDAPAAPVVNGLPGGMLVQFAELTPPGDGGSPITGYTASCTPVGGGASVSGGNTSSPIIVNGLTNGTSYTCTVLATNLNGDGPASTPSNVGTPSTVPDAPAAPLVNGLPAAMLVQFSELVPPADGFSPVTGYTASCTPVGGGASVSGGNTGSPIIVGGLTNGTSYTCTVFATNVNGDGPVSPPSNVGTPSTFPDGPAPPTLVPHDSSLDVTVIAPPDGGSPITSYSATCVSSDGGAPGTASAPESPVTVAGLTNGKTYTCTVSASNAAGAGPSSTASAPAVPSTVPGAPAKPGVGVAGPAGDIIAVSFTAPSDGFSPITSYTATCVSSDGGATASATALASPIASPIFVPGATVGSTYTCTVFASNGNGDGAASPPSDAIVAGTVSVPPGAPAAPTVVAGNGRITVAFLPPVDEGSSPITDYAAACAATGLATGVTHGSGSPLAVTGLTNGRSYTCTVVATNATGDGPPSSASPAVIPHTVPSRVGIPTVVAGNARISVAFRAPANGGSPITRYRITCASSNGGGSHTSLAIGSPFVMKPLLNGPDYHCAVAAANAAGWGASSIPSAFVRPMSHGFRMFTGDGSVFVFGDARFYGSARSASLVIAMATTRDNTGYWLVAQNGAVYPFGTARSYGSLAGHHLNRPIVGATATPTGRGYWLVASDGGIFAFGDARFFGSTGNRHLNQPIVGMTATATGRGYWFVAADGGLFAFGDAGFYGSAAVFRPDPARTPVVGMATAAGGRGYWIAVSDGRVFAFGTARVGRPSPISNLRLPIRGIAATDDGRGFWIAAGDGGLFVQGDAPYIPWPGPIRLNKQIRGISR